MFLETETKNRINTPRHLNLKTLKKIKPANDSLSRDYSQEFIEQKITGNTSTPLKKLFFLSIYKELSMFLCLDP